MTAPAPRSQPDKTELRHTPTPWTYRPNQHDDWGWIRDADGNLAACARDGRVWSDQFDEYRAAGTDPYQPNAAFIVEAVNSYASLKSRVKELERILRECRRFIDPDCDPSALTNRALTLQINKALSEPLDGSNDAA